MSDISIMGTLFTIIVIGLISVFFISLTLFIRRLLINSSVRSNESINLGKKLDKVIEQNEEIISLLKDEKQ